ncbi:T9SS sorting signal type C domain-containing protein [Flavobacterium wongokense]|uniref:T9SS sorting signal type C domain-containing protein n=1 Tax=Flavobacterium wongokense TaxID=2910674 RepID=UPI001F38422A|nr:T9SS sorting signal type C domain-containing protein [Flavobacterium sp. WG47]MCF6130814.1 T9SS sorting signal type C domain-containing protein [Flavobacterium sp. WG47]
MKIFTHPTIVSNSNPFKNVAMGFVLFALLLVSSLSFGQTTLLTENFGTTNAVLPTGWTSSNTTNGWNGSTASVSSTYPGFSAGANVLFAATGTNGSTHTLTYNNSLSTVGYTGITVLWGARGTATFSGAIPFEWSSDGTNWNAVTYTQVTYNANWALVNGGTRISLPSGAAGVSNLRFRWTGTSTNNGNFRIDDFTVQGTAGTTITSNAVTGNWSSTSSWVGGVVPTSADNAVIVSGAVITMDNGTYSTRNANTTTTVNSGGTLATAVTYTNNGTTTINGSFQLNSGGWVTSTSGTNNLVYGSAGTLIFNTSYTANNGNYWPTSSGPVNVTVNTSCPLDLGFARTVTGLFQTSANINNPGNITIGTNGTLQLNSGYGWSGTGNPIYGSASLLKYNSGGSPGRAAEWTATTGTIGTTPGYPNNVQVSNNTTLNFANGGTGTYKANGTLTVDAGSSLYQNFSGGNAGLAVVSDVIINGNITLGTSSGDLYVGGNLTVGASANFSTNGRAVFFNGAATQTITKTGAGTIAFDYLVVDKTAGSLVLSSSPATDITVNAASGNVLQLINTGGLDLNGRIITFNNSGGAIYVNGTRTINSTVAGGSLAFTNYKVVANNAGTGSLTLAANVTVNLNTNGNLDFGKSGAVYITTLNGTLSINSTTSCFVNTNPPIYGAAALLKYNSGGTYGRGLEWSTVSGAGYPNDVQVTNSTTLNYPNTAGAAFSTALALVRDLTIDTGSALYMDYGNGNNKSGALTVGRNIVLSGSLSLGDAVGGDLNVAGNWTLSGGTFIPNLRSVRFNGASAQAITGATTFDYLTLNNSTGLTLNNSVIVNQTLAFTSGKITLGTNNLNIGSAGNITGASTTNYVVAAGTGQLKRTVGGTATLFAVGNTAYNPITFTNSGTSDVYGVRVANTAPAGANNTKTVTRQWITTEAVAGGSTLTVVAQYNTGETGAGFAAATDYFIGHYNGTAYSQQAASTVAGANPFTVTTNTTLSPADLTTGTQYFAIGKDNGLLSVPSKYVVTAITPSSPTAGSGFSATVTVQDNYGSNTTLSASSSFSLTTNGNAGAISGTTTGTINSGSSSVVVSGIILANAGTGVTITATNTSGVAVATAGTSATFTVLAAADHLTFVGVPSTGNVGVNLASFTVEARRPDNSVDNTYTGNVTIAKASGTGVLSGTLTVAAVAGVATFSAAQFDTASTFTITANSGSFTTITSGNIVITLAPTVIAQFDFTTSPYINYTAKNANVGVTDFAISAGTLSTLVTTGSEFPNEPYVAGSGGYTTTTQTGAKNFNFTITANTGYVIEVTSMQFNALATAAGPSAFSYDIAGGSALYTVNAPDGTLVSVNQNTTGLTNLSTIPVLIQGWLNGSRSSSGAGNFRIDDVIVKGYVTCKTPATFTVGGGGAYCPGGTGVSVTLSGSETNVNYQLKVDGNNVGSAVPGTGSALNFGVQTTTGTYTVVATNTNGSCNVSQTMTGNAVLALPTTTSTDGGATWSNGTPTNLKAVIFNGGTGTISSDIVGCTLRLTNNATVTVASATDITLTGAITVDSGSTFTLNNNANLLQSGTTNSNTGNIIVKRNSSALKRLDYTLWSSPVTGQGVYSFSPFTFANRFYVYRTNTNVYNNADLGFNITGLNSDGVNGTDGNNVQFAQAKGYLIRMPWDHPTAATIWNGQFTGVPNNGDINFTMTNGGAGQRFNLVGNPYPSPISMTQFVSDNSTNITGTLYFWRETNGTTVNNAYCSWAGGTFVSNSEAQVFNPNGIIRTGQGFIVEASGAATALSFKNGQRSSDNSNQFFKSGNANVANDVEETNRFWLNLTNASGAFSQMAAGYMTNATNEVDLYDGKNINTGSVLLNSILDNTDYTIQGKALPFNTSDVIPLSFKVTDAGEYTIAIDHVDGLFSGSQAIILKDNLMDTEHDLKTGSYTFTADAGTSSNRFEVIYQTQLGTNNPTFTANNVIVYNQNNDFVINSGNAIMKSVKVFDIRGRLLQEKNNINASQTSISSGLSNGVHLIQITSEDGITVTKKVIR